jgi:uncharacterized OB-fold protein
MAAKPEPLLDVWNKPFWDACAEGRLMVQRCKATGRCWFPPGPVSPFAPKAGWEWITSSGKAEVASFVVFHQKYFDGFADELPYNVAMVRLDEGATLVTNVRAANESLHVGMKVGVFFERRGSFSVPLFRPEGAA